MHSCVADLGCFIKLGVAGHWACHPFAPTIWNYPGAC